MISKFNRIMGVGLPLLFALSCGTHAERLAKPPPEQTVETADLSDASRPLETRLLETQLLDAGYADLFMRMDDKQIQKLWKDFGAHQFHRALVASVLDTEARFLASEIVINMQKELPADVNRGLLAEAYVDVLAHRCTSTSSGPLKGPCANAWGLPGEVGHVAQHVIDLGNVVTPLLVALLEDEQHVLYEGSEEATIGGSYGYRVKDIAAFLLSVIESEPYEVARTPLERDIRIHQLAKSLNVVLPQSLGEIKRGFQNHGQ